MSNKIYYIEIFASEENDQHSFWRYFESEYKGEAETIPYFFSTYKKAKDYAKKVLTNCGIDNAKVWTAKKLFEEGWHDDPRYKAAFFIKDRYGYTELLAVMEAELDEALKTETEE